MPNTQPAISQDDIEFFKIPNSWSIDHSIYDELLGDPLQKQRYILTSEYYINDIYESACNMECTTFNLSRIKQRLEYLESHAGSLKYQKRTNEVRTSLVDIRLNLSKQADDAISKVRDLIVRCESVLADRTSKLLEMQIKYTEDSQEREARSEQREVHMVKLVETQVFWARAAFIAAIASVIISAIAILVSN